MSVADRVRIEEVKLLSDNWYVLKTTRFAFRRNDGSWQVQNRETYDRGNGAVILPYDEDRRTVLLVSQFRLPAFVNGFDDLMLEAPAGLLEGADPAERIRAEAEEECGYRIEEPQFIFSAFMSPGSVTERLHFYVGRYRPSDRISDGGGNPGEGEDIEVIELGVDRALAMIASGDIVDAKTIMLLQYAALHIFR